MNCQQQKANWPKKTLNRTMKPLTYKLVLPLTLISLVTFTKWWFVRYIDGPTEVITGFPLPFVCRGWHTSLSLQIYITELVIDIFTYFSFWFLIIYLINKYIKPIKVPRFLSIALLSLSVLICIPVGFMAFNPDNLYTITREDEMEIFETGFRFIWEEPVEPDYSKYYE